MEVAAGGAIGPEELDTCPVGWVCEGGGVLGSSVPVPVPDPVPVPVPVFVPAVEVLDDSSVVVLLDSVLEVDELVVVLDGGVYGGTVVTFVGDPPVTFPSGGRAAMGAPSSAPRMKSVHTLTGTVPPVSSPTPGIAFIWFAGIREPSPL